ncbi:UDP-2-acetamido-2-deoxy-3-oxo-D-glucuronate aminotransferase [Sedimentisphaera cyanobacteriorum]|uniref:UDP-2-acetamido-2-deoxy-3-oxo-D-glucuronate aminotransferase n=2 Tax=Sedimentisphaera cyanobacteriorum TaxID=1940790 RepID=A0A1Q2HNS6_9BACT|nr:UDP-2-acetamido-2-deoxy-3-oxo-D-glucuronate aminotransferase [Sedimentisphaera cyanobacteriorum]
MNSSQKYQTNLKSIFGAFDAFTMWKGRVALYAILRVLGIGKGDEVILPGYTCVMDVNPVKYVGANPVYVDIEPDTFNMDVSLLEQAITPNTKLIIAQHTYGYVCDMDELMGIAEKYGVTVIEDCCLCVGSTYKGKLAGTFGIASYFSGQWNKPFTTGIGGMVTCNDENVAQDIQELCENELIKPSFKEVLMLQAQLWVYKALIYPRTTALAQNLFRWLTKKGIVVGSSSNEEFEPKMPENFFKAMSSVQAKEGVKKMKSLEANIEHRKKMSSFYDELLGNKGWGIRQFDSSKQDPVMVRYPVRVKDKQKAIEDAAKHGIELGTWFECALHPIETPLEKYDYEIGMCPVADKACEQVVNLPLHTRVSKKTARRTVDFITKYCEEAFA